VLAAVAMPEAAGGVGRRRRWRQLLGRRALAREQGGDAGL